MAQHFLERVMQREAYTQGTDWTHYIENQLFKLPGLHKPDGSFDPKQLPDVQRFREILTNVFEVGHVYQIDYVNLLCLCDISLSAPRMLVGQGSDDHDHADHEGSDHNTEKLKPRVLNHVLKSSKPHAPGLSATAKIYKYPIDRALVTSAAKNVSDDVYIRTTNTPGFPKTFGEVFHPVTMDGEVVYVLRAMVDLEEEAAQYKSTIAIAFMFSALVLLFAIGYPARQYLRSLKRQQSADRRAKFLASHDVLTNLHNRNDFQESVSDILWKCQEEKTGALVFLFDLNGFKEVNDYYGHHVGDSLLCAFAEMLKKHVPDGGYVARLGGDEFVVVLSGLPLTITDPLAHLRLPNSVGLHINRGQQYVSATISGGVVQFPKDAQRTSDLMQMADLALYAAKPNRAGEVQIYQSEMKENFLSRLTLRDEFRMALDRSELVPFYQPIVNMRTGQVVAFEALARWDHPKKGILTPLVFEDIFEDGELSALLGQQMFNKIADDMEIWKANGIPFHKVGLNVVNGDLKQEEFAHSLLTGLAQRGLSPSNLVIEVTENCLFGRDKAAFLVHLETLREAGCSIALDDFGTGYSSITQLKELPVSSVKIDKSFVENILDNEDDKSIIRALLGMSHSMNFKLVLEGMETVDQVNFLKDMGFVLAQGYYFSKPVSAAQVPALVLRQNAMYTLGDKAG